MAAPLPNMELPSLIWQVGIDTWLAKNRDDLLPELTHEMRDSSSLLLSSLFKQVTTHPPPLMSHHSPVQHGFHCSTGSITARIPIPREERSREKITRRKII